MKPLLTACGLGHRYGEETVFAQLDFVVESGMRLAILGASGSGKTTLLRLIAGLLTPSTGEVKRAPGLTIGMVFQDLALWPNLTALQNVTLVLRHVSRQQRKAIALEALARCQIQELANRLPVALSVGQQQRLALARAIAGDPELLLLDEPFSSLDLVLKTELFDIVRAIASKAALILVTHDPLEAMALCETALELEAGKSAEVGALRSLLANPTSQLLKAFAKACRFEV